VLVTGATGYVGGRLIPELLAAGFTVRALARNVSHLENRPWINDVETAQADLQDPDDVESAFKDVHTVLYLVHSMGSSKDFENKKPTSPDTWLTARPQPGYNKWSTCPGFIQKSP